MSDNDIALKRFDIISRWYAFETTMYWTRSHFYMVANAGLLAFAASRLLEPTVDHPYLLMLVCAFGFVMTLCWHLVLRSGQYWTDRWERICLLVEPSAMGDIEIFSNLPLGRPHFDQEGCPLNCSALSCDLVRSGSMGFWQLQ
jgi:hypothetical protein